MAEWTAEALRSKLDECRRSQRDLTDFEIKEARQLPKKKGCNSVNWRIVAD